MVLESKFFLPLLFYKIDSLKSDLSIAWPSIYGDDDAFWAKQWEKHGICSTFKQYEYFKHALELWKAHNITSLLEEKGITPGACYDYQHINTTILAEIGSVPHITCEGSTYLAEIHLCFDAATATQFVSCSPFAQSNCMGKKGMNKISFER
ncbi:putative physarum polycephalum ribonuclease [Medicago truncatula]|uniref:Putative physarum polycephalum ribonuclease n=1 Tax=Medicago truncatula TaxID=3880 RepID=A0A396J3H7_MEDTR|nr:putative physarum polycephalum ribonuclease [Medicago truncatula]